MEDLGSENGTYVRVADPVTLENLDTVMMGRQVFRVEFQ
jgi:pSer/pThr/pTyr-binding forkhead associated (FHA) protein